MKSKTEEGKRRRAIWRKSSIECAFSKLVIDGIELF
jgi:hypothetical protein